MAVPTCVWLAKQRLLGRSLQSTCSSCIELLIDRSSMLGELLAAPPRPRRAAAKLARKSAQEEPRMEPRGNFPERKWHLLLSIIDMTRSTQSSSLPPFWQYMYANSLRVHAHPQLCHADDSRSCQTASSKPHGKQRESLRILRACSQTSASGPHARDARPLRARRARRADRAALRALRGRSRDLAGRGGRGAGCDERQCGGHTHCAALAA